MGSTIHTIAYFIGTDSGTLGTAQKVPSKLKLMVFVGDQPK